MENFSSVDSRLQFKIFRRVVELSWDDVGYGKIIKTIATEFSVKLNKSNLSYWANNNVKLFGGRNNFLPKKSLELAYILGVMFGDGTLHFDEKKKDYVIRLDAIDKDFVERFSKYVSKVLGKDKFYSVCQMGGRGYSTIYSTRARSKELFYFIKDLKEDFEKVKHFAETYPKEFIQGLADSEGCPQITATKSFRVNILVACSSNDSLLIYVKNLLKIKFGIGTRFYLSKKAGVTDSIINGRPITRTMNLYGLDTISFENSKLFSKCVGFSIGRKQTKLLVACRIFENFEKKEMVVERLNLYYKKNNMWVTKDE